MSKKFRFGLSENKKWSWTCMISSGREFHSLGVATEKALSGAQSHNFSCGDTLRSLWFVDPKGWVGSYKSSTSFGYSATRSFIKHHNQYLELGTQRIGSKCRCQSTDVRCFFFLEVLINSLGVAFWANWHFQIVFKGSPTEAQYSHTVCRKRGPWIHVARHPLSRKGHN